VDSSEDLVFEKLPELIGEGILAIPTTEPEIVTSAHYGAWLRKIVPRDRQRTQQDLQWTACQSSDEDSKGGENETRFIQQLACELGSLGMAITDRSDLPIHLGMEFGSLCTRRSWGRDHIEAREHFRSKMWMKAVGQ
jgi:hypothetical protein